MDSTLQNSLAFLLIAFAVWCIHSVWVECKRSQGRQLPPGPGGLPIVGNLFNFPRIEPWLVYHELSVIYGDVLHFRVLGQSTVVLGTSSAVTEYLNQRSANTSDRRQTPLIQLTGGSMNFGHLPYGHRWRLHRRAFWQHFNPRSVAAYEPLLQKTTRQLLGAILKAPYRVQNHLHYTFAATLMELLYGIEARGEDDEFIATVNNALAGSPDGRVPGKSLIMYLPFLRHFLAFLPGVGFTQQYCKWRMAANALKDVPFAYVKREMENETRVRESVIGKLLAASPSETEEEEDLIKNIGAVSFDAGADTTLSTLQAALLSLSLNPDMLRKAQAELDVVVGPDRLPDFKDMDSLVYLNAILKETLRWHNVVPLGVPHCTIDDDEFRGYFIPKGTVLLPNVWACMHDPEVFERPEEFLPERFIRDGKLNPGPIDPANYVFGFGRRICPGQHYSEAFMFITLASILHVFDVSTPQAKSAGQPIVNEMRASNGYLLYPERCQFFLDPRGSRDLEALL